ncbi:MAG TPA: hypothetical protein VFN78_03740 [Ktedonobacterales bacterium]|nr:hypothetical protein [Ktedonobacterales bacterium]
MTSPSLSRNPLRDYPTESAVATETANPMTGETAEVISPTAEDLVESYEASVRRVATIIAASLVVAAIATGAAVTLARLAAKRRAQTTP